MPVRDMSKTQIFVTVNKEKTKQLVVYSNHVENSYSNNAMILPIPNPKSLKFIDLSNYSDIFDDCLKCFGPLRNTFSANLSNSKNNYLKVFDVGSYSVSIVYSLDDLYKIDKSVFNIDMNCVKLLKNTYGKTKFGFIVCKLKTGENKYHPLAYSHNIGNKVLVPTKHYHGNSYYGGIADDWDHVIYLRNISHGGDCKLKSENDIVWNGIYGDKKNIDIDTNKIDFDFGDIERFHRINIVGSHPNRDIILEAECDSIINSEKEYVYPSFNGKNGRNNKSIFG
jgi:hypothetical protein